MSTYALRRLQQVSRCLQQNPGGISGCSAPCGMSLDVSSRSRGVSSRIQEASLDVANLMVCRWMSPAGLQWNPGGIIGCSECQYMSCEGSSESPGVSSRIQEVSFTTRKQHYPCQIYAYILLFHDKYSTSITPLHFVVDIQNDFHWINSHGLGYSEMFQNIPCWYIGGILVMK